MDAKIVTEVLTAVVRSIFKAWNAPLGFIRATDTGVTFTTIDARGEVSVWVDFDGVTLGGMGRLAGSLSEGLVSIAHDAVKALRGAR